MAFTCPRCGATSHNPNDEREGYCGRCHDWTGAPNYVNRIVGRLSGLLDDCDVDLLRVYALLALVKGEQVTEEDVHDAWSVWRTATRPAHPSLVPFDQLPPEVQAMDTRYADAIRAAAAALGS